MQLTRYARLAAFAILGVVTLYGLYQFSTSGSATVVEYWRARLPLLPLIALMASLDVLFEGLAWIWIYSRFGIQSWNGKGAIAFLAGRAGLLLPAQLGRLIRPDAIARLGLGSSGECLKAEAATFVLDTTSVAALLAAWIAATQLHLWAAPVAALCVIAVPLLLGNQVAKLLADTPLALPRSFWWSWQTFGIVLVEMAGWTAHGLAFFVMIRHLPGNVTWTDTVFFTSASSVIGASSGLPGGIGATEGLLGMSLTIMHVPEQHLAIAVGAFRLFTFWMWIPIGWLALTMIRKQQSKRAGNREELEKRDERSQPVDRSQPACEDLKKAA